MLMLLLLSLLNKETLLERHRCGLVARRAVHCCRRHCCHAGWLLLMLAVLVEKHVAQYVGRRHIAGHEHVSLAAILEPHLVDGVRHVTDVGELLLLLLLLIVANFVGFVLVVVVEEDMLRGGRDDNGCSGSGRRVDTHARGRAVACTGVCARARARRRSLTARAAPAAVDAVAAHADAEVGRHRYCGVHLLRAEYTKAGH